MSEMNENQTTPEQVQAENTEPQHLDLKELLKTHPELRSQLDKHTSSALNTAKAKWEQEQSLPVR